ncbi:hypothetical protein B566_EDAN015814 [Ephemera danica]|nr:hypothetical protein B566_EDAN015814 [Ephemera danica]
MKWLLLAILIAPCMSQLLHKGVCPAVNNQIDLTVPKFSGVWYEYSRTRFWTGFEVDCTCYEIDSNSTDSLNVTYNSVTPRFNQAWHKNFNVPLSGPLNWTLSFDNSTLRVLGGISKHYLVLWTCQPLPGMLRYESLLILTRNPMPEDVVVQLAIMDVYKCGMSSKMLMRTRQKDCEKDYANAMNDDDADDDDTDDVNDESDDLSYFLAFP